jgi:hypothetical protein
MQSKGLQKIVTKWRRNRERSRRLAASPAPIKRPAEVMESKPGTLEVT